MTAVAAALELLEELGALRRRLIEEARGFMSAPEAGAERMLVLAALLERRPGADVFDHLLVTACRRAADGRPPHSIRSLDA